MVVGFFVALRVGEPPRALLCELDFLIKSKKGNPAGFGQAPRLGMEGTEPLVRPMPLSDFLIGFRGKYIMDPSRRVYRFFTTAPEETIPCA